MPEPREERGEPAPLVVLASAIGALRKRWREALQGRFTTHEVTDRALLGRSLTRRAPAALLLDVNLPALGGVEGVAAVQQLKPAVKTVVLTSHPDEREGITALKAGARGYCDRDIDTALLCKALDVVQKGEIWVGRKLIPHLLDELTALTQQGPTARAPERDTRLDRITPREREIVQLLSAGASNKEIAKDLRITERTVKAHLTAVFRKLGISGRLQLALFALEHSRPPAFSGGIGPRVN